MSNTPRLIDEVKRAFAPVIGLKLSIARNAGNMKVFHFGNIRPHPHGGTMGDFALHVQCPWRIVTVGKMITGSYDYYEPADSQVDRGDWQESRPSPSLQDRHIAELFGCAPETRRDENVTELLVVERVEADDFGGLEIHLSGGYRLQIFPNSTSQDASSEEWRLFEPYGTHFIVSPNGVFEWQPTEDGDGK